MKLIGLSGSQVGSKTRTAMNEAIKKVNERYPDIETEVIDLAEYSMLFSDGRHYLDYEEDTGYVTQQLMAADAVIIGMPIFQASIPGALKNVFDLLPVDAFRDKTVSMLVTAGSPKHYLVADLQLKPILSYMKAQIVQTYVFIEEKDFHQKEIINTDVLDRLDRLAEDTVVLSQTFEQIRESQYDF